MNKPIDLEKLRRTIDEAPSEDVAATVSKPWLERVLAELSAARGQGRPA